MELQQITEPGSGSPAQQTPGAPPPAPSPLSGCYLLIVIGEPHSPEHKEIILQRIAKGRTTDCNVACIDVNKRKFGVADGTQSMPTTTVTVSRRYFRFRLYVVSFNIVLRHSLLCGEIGQSEPSLMTLLISLLKY